MKQQKKNVHKSSDTFVDNTSAVVQVVVSWFKDITTLMSIYSFDFCKKKKKKKKV